MSVACATVHVRRCPASGPRLARCAKATSSCVPLNDGYNWKSNPNATISGQGVRGMHPGLIRGCHHRRVRVWPSHLGTPAPAPAPASRVPSLDPETRRHPSRREVVHAGKPGASATEPGQSMLVPQPEPASPNPPWSSSVHTSRSRRSDDGSATGRRPARRGPGSAPVVVQSDLGEHGEVAGDPRLVPSRLGEPDVRDVVVNDAPQTLRAAASGDATAPPRNSTAARAPHWHTAAKLELAVFAEKIRRARASPHRVA